MDWFINLRAHTHGGPVGSLRLGDGTNFYDPEVQPQYLKDLLGDINGRHVILMAHGYNVNQPNGVGAMTQWRERVVPGINQNVVYIGVLWPGDCILPIFIDYVWEGSEATQSGIKLGQFVRDNFGSAASLTFMSHSLGARVVLTAIDQLQDPMIVRDLITLAGAIEDDTLTNEFANAARRCKRITSVHSWEDEVLKLAYPAGNLLGGLFERDDANLKSALGRSGPVQTGGNILSDPRLPSGWNYGHTDYMDKHAVDGTFSVPIYPLGDPTAPGPWPTYIPAPLETVKDMWKPCWSPAFAATRWLMP